MTQQPQRIVREKRRSPLPFYFGSAEKPLFGVYHTPRGGVSRDCGIVLCAPVGREYINTHRAIRQLALRLSDAGFHALRFDFYGCGDSSGDCEQGEIRQWLTDISTAINEIRARCGMAKVCLVGCRLGGTLATMVAAERGDIETLVLWDGVVNGQAHLEKLSVLHQEMIAYAHIGSSPSITDEKFTEILGFPLTDLMRVELQRLDLLTIQKKPANNILLIESDEVIEGNEASDGELFRAHLKSLGTHLAYQHLPSPRIWGEPYTVGLTPIQILQAVVSWISEVCT